MAPQVMNTLGSPAIGPGKSGIDLSPFGFSLSRPAGAGGCFFPQKVLQSAPPSGRCGVFNTKDEGVSFLGHVLRVCLFTGLMIPKICVQRKPIQASRLTEHLEHLPVAGDATQRTDYTMHDWPLMRL